MQHFEADLLRLGGVPPNAVRARPEFITWVLSPAGASWCGSAGCTPVLTAALHEAVDALAAR
jgi:penicillin amidase